MGPTENPVAPENVFLVGPMGSGKTTLGRRVAATLGLEFLDCDQELEKRTGASVNLIFDVEGESGFRQRETRLLRAFTSREGVLVATGGGIVMRKANRDLLRQGGLVVWLKTAVERQMERLARDKARPLLQAQNRMQHLRELAGERDPRYAEIADLVFESGQRNVNLAATKLGHAIREHWRVHGSKADHAKH